jgi:uncharacterized protein YoxC
MRKNSLAKTGLSLSQAQSISNLCNQRALEIAAKLNGVNNYSKTVEVSNVKGDGKIHTIVVGKELPADVVALLNEKASLHACQAFLMENIKAKDTMLKAAKSEIADLGDLEAPERPKVYNPAINQLPNVDEEFGWSQLTASELNEYLEAEAYAAHIGQFIHEDKPLDKLRKELGKGIAPVEWMIIHDGMKSPVEVTTHHTPEQLLAVHEELAKTHREKEQRVNYFKAKVKNLSTAENARIANVNADAQADAENKNNIEQSTYDTAFKAYSEKVKTIRANFEKDRQAKIKETAVLRIEVDKRFQPVVDIFLKQLPDSQE